MKIIIVKIYISIPSLKHIYIVILLSFILYLDLEEAAGAVLRVGVVDGR